MEQNFASLSKRQTMLLLTALSFGGSDALKAFDYLSLEEEELLKHRAQALLQIPREKRIPLLVQEIKRLFTQRRRSLGAGDPAKLAELLAAERPAMVEVMLKVLPVSVAEAVSARLGHDRALVALSREVKPEILSVIRWKLEAALRTRSQQIGTFRFSDLLVLQPRELLAICDRMGARVLATSIAGLADAAREAFLAKLPPDQRALAQKASEAGRAKRLEEADASGMLELHGALEDPSAGLRSAGAQRLVRAAVAHSVDFAGRLVQRYHGELGKLLSRWLREERSRPVKGDGGRLAIVEQMERLAQRGIIDRPMRLSPPAPPPPSSTQDEEAQERSSRSSGGRASEDSRSGRSSGTGRGHADPEAPRDPIAERRARRAGALSAIADRPRPKHSSRSMAPAGGSEHTNTGAGARSKVLRDGRPLQREAAASPAERGEGSSGGKTPVRSPAFAPVVQAIPRRKEKASTSTSPVLKGAGRGPAGGSR